MGKRFAILIGAAALGAAVMAAGASADFTSVHDPRGDTQCTHGHKVADKPCSDQRRRNADIVRARAGHDGALLKHTIRVAGKFRSVHLLIDTDSDSSCEWGLFVMQGEQPFGECTGQGQDHGLIGHARVDFHRHSVEISFPKSSIGNPASYGWTAYTWLGGVPGSAFDHVPNGVSLFHYIEHGLGDSGVPAAGVMALGAQTALAGGDPVDSTPPDLQLSGPKKDDPQNDGPICDGGACNVNVKASCGDEECTTRATGKLTNVNRDKLTPEISVVEPGQRFNVGPELAKEAQRREVRKALRKGKNVKAKVTVRAKDAAGNVATAKRTVRLVSTQTAVAEVVKYDTELTLTKEGGGGGGGGLYHGWVMSDRDRNPKYDPAKGVRKCMVGRVVVLFKLRPGADRKLGTDRSEWGPTGQLFKGRDAAPQWPQSLRQGRWEERTRRDYGDRVRAEVKRKVRARYVCRADRAVYSQ